MKKTVGIIAAAIAWFALVAQFMISIQSNLARGSSVASGIWMYFAFFTVTTNLLVALTLTMPVVAPSSRLGRFLAKPSSITGATASIILVAVVYNTLLIHLNRQQGWRFVTDLLLHFVVPMLTIAYWWIAVRRASVPWKSALCWTLYPIAYFCYTTARGLTSGFYPVLFHQRRATWSSAGSLLNAIGVLAAFVIILIALLALKSSFRAAESPKTAA